MHRRWSASSKPPWPAHKQTSVAFNFHIGTAAHHRSIAPLSGRLAGSAAWGFLLSSFNAASIAIPGAKERMASADRTRMVIEIAALLIGTLCVVLGYKLLMRGVYPDADAKSVWSDARLLIKRSAPGMMFASFGAAMIVMGLLHGNELHHRAAAAAPQDTQTEETSPAKHSSQAQPVKRKRAGDES